MGTWGTAIFSDDLASDIKGQFRDKIGFGKSSAEATAELVAEYEEELKDTDESNVFWLALASTQWTLGRLQDDVKQKALKIIESGNDLERWTENEQEKSKRQKILNKLKEQLLTDQPAPKKISVPFIRETKMEVGDLLSYKHSSGNFAIIRVLNIGQDHCGDRYPQIEILDHFSDSIPNSKGLDAHQRKVIQVDQEDKFSNMHKSSGTFYVAPYGKRDREPWEKLSIIEKGTKIPDYKGTVSTSWWRDFDKLISKLFEQ